MRDKLTQNDLELMRRELDRRRLELRPRLIDEVKRARAFGDLSENFEYKAAKKEKNDNDSRIRYLENMIRTAVVVEDGSGSDTVGLYDTVTVFMEDVEETEVWQVVTTVRQNVLEGRMSLESPMGKAMLGRREGERFYVQVSEKSGYYAVVKKIEKGNDDGSAPLNKY